MPISAGAASHVVVASSGRASYHAIMTIPKALGRAIRFAGRLDTSHGLTALFAARANRLRAELPLVDLSILNPTLAGIEYPDGEIRDAIARAAGARYEPEPFGSMPARSAVAEDFARRGISIDPARICLAASTSDALAQLFKLLADPGDVVLVPRPGYPLLDILAPLDGLRVGSYAVEDDGAWVLPSPPPECRVVLAMAPHMPGGTLPTRESLERLSRFCHASGAALIIDEVFADYADSGIGSAATMAPLVFRLGGLSKTAGLPGVKLGWIAAEGNPVVVRDALERLEHIADAYLSVNQIAMSALPDLLSLAPCIRANISSRIRENLATLSESSIGKILRSTGASWTAVIEVDDDEQVAAALLDRGWWVHPGYLYDYSEPRIVVSLLTPADPFRDALPAIEEATGCITRSR